MLIPYRVDVAIYRWPIANFVIIGLCCAVFGLELSTSGEGFEPLVLSGWTPLGFLGYMWLHGSWLHLIGNMLFLWIFGNAVCAKIGNLAYPAAYVGFGLAAGLAHVLTSPSGAIGASGAINGVVGAFLVLYPLNDVSCAFFFFFRLIRFSVSSVWVILFWLAFDIWGAWQGGGMVAYAAHLGGFAAGFIGMAVAVRLRWIEMDRADRSLLRLLKLDGGKPAPAMAAPSRAAAWAPKLVTPARPSGPGAGSLSRPATVPGAMRPGTMPSAGPTAPPRLSPMSPQPAVRPAPAAGPPVASSDILKVECVCGAVIQAPRRLAGKRAKCPKCSQPLQIPLA